MFRYTGFDAEHFGVLAPHLSLAFEPGLNLIVGDRRRGKSTLVGALLAAWRGTSEPEAELRLHMDASGKAFELLCGRTVELRSKPDRSVFVGPSWDGLLAALEYETGCTGLAQTVRWPVEPRDFLVPSAFCPFLGASPRIPADQAQERSRLTRLVAALTQADDTAGQREERLAVLVPKLARIKGGDKGLRELGRLAAVRRLLEELPRDPPMRAEAMARAQADLAAFQSLATVLEPLPPLEKQREEVAALVAAQARIEVELDSGPRLAEDCLSRLDALEQARQAIRQQQDDLKTVEATLADVERLAPDHAQGLSWPDDFPARLAEVRTRQTGIRTLDAPESPAQNLQARLAEAREKLEAERARQTTLTARQAALQADIQSQYADLVELPTDLEACLDEYVRTSAERRSVEERRQRLWSLEGRLQQNFAPLLQLSAAQLTRLDVVRDEEVFCRRLLDRMDAERTERARVEAALDAVQVELVSLQGWDDVPDGLPAVLTVRAALEADLAEQEQRLEAIEQQLALVLNSLSPDGRPDEGGLLSMAGGIYDLVARWEEHFRSKREGTTLALWASQSQASLGKLQKQLKKDGLPLADADLAEFESLLLELHRLRKQRKKSEALTQAEESLEKRLQAWKVASVDEAYALVGRHREASSRLAALRTQVTIYEGLQTHRRAQEARAGMLKHAVVGGRTVVDLSRGEDRCHTLLVLQARRTELARSIERLRKMLPADGDVVAYQRHRELSLQRLDLQARLQVLRPSEAMEAERGDLMKLATRTLQTVGLDVTAEHYLGWRRLQEEVDELRASLVTTTALEDARLKVEQLIGREAAQAPEAFLARWREYRSRAAEQARVEADMAELDRLEAEAKSLRAQSDSEAERMQAEAATTAGLESETREACAALQVPVDDGQDVDLLARFEAAVTWRSRRQGLQQQKGQLESAGAALQVQVRELETHLALGPEAATDALRDKAHTRRALEQRRQDLKAQRDALPGLEAATAAVDVCVRTAVARIAAVEAEVQSRFKGISKDELAQAQAWQAEADTVSRALRASPSRVELSLRLEAARHRLAGLDPERKEDGPGSLNEADARCLVRASEFLAYVTKGTHAGLSVRKGTIMVDAHDDWSPLPGGGSLRRVSELCWYLAVCLELGEAHPWPVIVDDPFRQVDDPGRVLALLQQIAEQQQVIVLTANRTLGLRPLADLSAARG